jgi:hypothetical protein
VCPQCTTEAWKAARSTGARNKQNQPTYKMKEKQLSAFELLEMKTFAARRVSKLNIKMLANIDIGVNGMTDSKNECVAYANPACTAQAVKRKLLAARRVARF